MFSLWLPYGVINYNHNIIILASPNLHDALQDISSWMISNILRIGLSPNSSKTLISSHRPKYQALPKYVPPYCQSLVTGHSTIPVSFSAHVKHSHLSHCFASFQGYCVFIGLPVAQLVKARPLKEIQ